MHSILSRKQCHLSGTIFRPFSEMMRLHQVKQKNSSHREHSQVLNNDRHVNKHETLNGAKFTQNFHRFCD